MRLDQISANPRPHRCHCPLQPRRSAFGWSFRRRALLAADILALEVIWSPENPDDAMTEDELLTEYPELSGL
jgi:hypothetical protein